MNRFYDEAASFWTTQSNDLNGREWNQKLNSGMLGLPHYIGFLLETYHNAGLNPQLQGYATLYFSDKKRDVVKKFFQHAISEIAHDLLAMDDLHHLGIPKDYVLNSRPLPTTKAFFANTLYDVQRYGAPAYLAYLFHLEFSPVTNGGAIINMLKAKGIPENALSFLHEHSTVDVNHLKLMKTYMDSLVTTDEERKVFFESLHDVIVLHNRMLEGAFENGERLFKTTFSSLFASVS